MAFCWPRLMGLVAEGGMPGGWEEMRMDGAKVLPLGWRSHRAWQINYFCDEKEGRGWTNILEFWNLDDWENGIDL